MLWMHQKLFATHEAWRLTLGSTPRISLEDCRAALLQAWGQGQPQYELDVTRRSIDITP